jgi:hypothetical protein
MKTLVILVVLAFASTSFAGWNPNRAMASKPASVKTSSSGSSYKSKGKSGKAKSYKPAYPKTGSYKK